MASASVSTATQPGLSSNSINEEAYLDLFEGKKKYLTDQMGPEAINLMRAIKQTMDPNNILNPEKIF